MFSIVYGPLLLHVVFSIYIMGVESNTNMFQGNRENSRLEKSPFHELTGDVVFVEESWIKGRTDPSGGISEKCMELLDMFSNETTTFLTCILNYSRPLHYCEKCVTEFAAVLNRYNAISADEVNGTTCQDELLRADNVQVILLAYDFVESVWDKSLCHNCYNCTVDKNGTTVYKATEQTLEMLKKIDEVQDCFRDFAEDSANNETVCKVCKSLYSSANKYYNMLDDDEMLCSDLEDSMNYTRRMWSKKFKCTIAVRTDLVIYGMSIAMAFLPALLYIGAFVYGKIQDKKRSSRDTITAPSGRRILQSDSVNPETDS